MEKHIEIRAGDTEPLSLELDAKGLVNLDELIAATFFARRVAAAANEVEARPMTVIDSPTKILSFDPVGNGPGGIDAFLTPGIYDCYVKAVWTDNNITQHPSEDGGLLITVTKRYE